ncbi:DNA cytosine methyltransferase [Mesorhizobium sp. 113-1-2]|uniref:DNA cytosine methyltransferase n=1 Tax=Mesorhizobium sp. 113-1-2 TaxID=2744515 RepID=UPI0019263C70
MQPRGCRWARRSRAQTFPDGFEVLGSINDVQRQLGNAVPALLVEVLATEIRTQLPRSPAQSDQMKRTIASTDSSPIPTLAQPVPASSLKLRGTHAAQSLSGCHRAEQVTRGI